MKDAAFINTKVILKVKSPPPPKKGCISLRHRPSNARLPPRRQSRRASGQDDYRRFTYVVRLQLDSVAEDKRVEVGLLEDLVKGALVLQRQTYCRSVASRARRG